MILQHTYLFSQSKKSFAETFDNLVLCHYVVFLQWFNLESDFFFTSTEIKLSRFNYFN
jgi:hypothetical protein